MDVLTAYEKDEKCYVWISQIPCQILNVLSAIPSQPKKMSKSLSSEENGHHETRHDGLKHDRNNHNQGQLFFALRLAVPKVSLAVVTYSIQKIR